MDREAVLRKAIDTYGEESQEKMMDKEEMMTQKIKEAYKKAPIAPQKVIDTTDCFYSEYFGRNNGYFFEWIEFFEYWNDNHLPEDDRPEFVWITDSVEMSINATSVVELATDDLYEDAFFDVEPSAIKELQSFLDNWCKHCGVGTTYYFSHKYKIRIPWEIYIEGDS